MLFCHTTDLLNLTDSSVKLSANQKKKKKRKEKEQTVKLAAAKLFDTYCFCLNIHKHTFSVTPITRVTDKSCLSSLKEENFRRQRFFFFFLVLYDCERIRKQ